MKRRAARSRPRADRRGRSRGRPDAGSHLGILHAVAETVSVPSLITSTLALHEDLLKPKQISVHVGNIPETQVRGNFHDLQQVLTNVLLNARDAVGARGNIWIAAEENGERVNIRVKDDGRGIAADLLGRIFEPLVTTKRGQGGTGLGLAIARRILRASDGDISVQSTPGHGAEFTISLPCSRGMTKDTETNAHSDRR